MDSDGYIKQSVQLVKDGDVWIVASLNIDAPGTQERTFYSKALAEAYKLTQYAKITKAE